MVRIFPKLIALAVASALAGCVSLSELNAPVGRAEAIVEAALQELSAESGSWQRILEETRERLLQEGLQDAAAQVETVLQRGVQTAGIEFRCSTEFVGQRVGEGLQGVLDDLLGRETSAPDPVVCSTSPATLRTDLVARNQTTTVEIDGFNLDSGSLELVHEIDRGDLVVTSHLVRNSHYRIVVPLGSNGLAIDSKSRKIVLKDGDRVLSEIAVVEPLPPECDVRTVMIPSRTYGPFVPQPRNGHRDWDSNPLFNLWVQARTTSDRVSLDVKFRGVGYSGAEAQIDSSVELYRVSTEYPDYRLDSLDFARNFHFAYRDGDHDDDRFSSGTGIVRTARFVGDTNGDEVGTKTSVEITTNRLPIRIRRYRNCR